MKNIYVVLPRSETFIAKIARKITKYEYSHVTICLNDKFEEFFSFSRIYNKAPVISGFVKETRADLVSKKNLNLKCKIFKITISNKKYEGIIKFINEVKQDNEYMFNYISMLLVTINSGFKIYKAHNCCEFVSIILYKLGIVDIDKPCYKFTPKDFDILLSNKYYFYEGFLNVKKEDTGLYYKNVNKLKKIYYSFYLIREIIYRIILKKPSKNYDNKKLYKIYK